MKHILLLINIFILSVSYSQCPSGPGGSCDGGSALDLYWVGTNTDNSGNWSSPCSWRVGSLAGVEPCQAPRSNDNVFFLGGSFTGATPTITVSSQARCNNLFVDPTVNSIGVTPIFHLENPGFLEIYGSFTLQPNLTWTVIGGNNSGPEILFKATTANQTITTAGHTMGAVQFDGIGGEWALQDDYNGGSLNFAFGYLNTSDGTNDYDMTLFTFDSDVQPGGSSANRRLDLNSSTITMTVAGGSFYDRYPYNTTNAPYTVWECRGTTAGSFNFNAGTSKIIFTATSPFLRLGGLSYNVINHTGNGRFYDHFGPQPCLIDTFETNGYLYFHHEHTFNVLKINSVSKTHNFFRNQEITGDLIVSGNVCNPTVFKSEYTKTLTMPASVAADPMNGFLINNLKCSDGTAGHIINGTQSGNTTGWTITPPASRDLYWVGGVSATGNWSDPTNWSTSNTGVPLLTASDCPPTQTDNVFFISTLADGDNIVLDDIAYCNNQTWNITVPATLSGNKIMNIFGNLTFDVDMVYSATNRIDFWGANANTIFSAGKTFKSTTYFWDNSDYKLLDDLSFTYIYFYQHNNFTSNSKDLTGRRLTFRGTGAINFSSSTITLDNYIPWNLAGGQGTITYDANSHVIATHTGTYTHIYGWGGHPHFPKFTLQSPNTTLRFRDHLKSKNLKFDGDVILNGGAQFRANHLNGTAHGPLSSITINGNLTLSQGKNYLFNSINPIVINGDVIANGSCSEYITVEGYNGVQYNMDVTGTGNFDYCNISDLNAINPENATNSLDLGNNTNITFPAGASLTYYWRALNGSCTTTCNYAGNWASIAGYWTTNAANTEGVPGCIPGPYDNVVFDNMSFDGTNISYVVINSTISCHDITVTASNVELLSTGNLKITGSINSDGTLLAPNYSGSIDFVSNSSETIDFGGITLGCDVSFANALGSWTLINNPFTTSKVLTLVSGTLNTNGQTLNIDKFYSNNTSTRALNLGNSIFNINGSGNFISTTSPSNSYTWNTDMITNFTFNAGTSTVNFNSGNELTIKSSGLTFHHVNFTNTNSIVSSSPVLLIKNWDTKHMIFSGSGRIYGDNSYDTLEFSPGKVYKIESNSTQTFKNPNGVLIATGTAGNEIAIKSSTTGTPSTFHKLNSSNNMSSFCFDYISVEDNFASSDDGLFKFFTGSNSNNISASGIWDFTRPVFITPSIKSFNDQNNCGGNTFTIGWELTGSGPYKLTYSDGTTPTTVTIADGITSYTATVSVGSNTEFTVSSFTADNCGVNTLGTIVDNNQWVYLPTPTVIAQDNDSAYCDLVNENSFIHFHESPSVSQRPLLSISDNVAGVGLGNVATKIEIDATVQTFNMVPYLQRRFSITPTNNESAKVRLYFTQGELDALSTEWGSVLALSDLSVTKYDNSTMAFTTPSTVLQPTAFGNIPGGITTSLNILYVEIDVHSFSHFVIHPTSITPLPVELIEFTATQNNNFVDLKWITASETNNNFFTIQRSIDTENWINIENVNGAGNSSHTLTYLEKDRQPIIGISYYRLKQTDFNGDYQYSNIQKVDFKLEQSTVLVYPNPTEGRITLKGKSKEIHNFILVNMQGQIITNLVKYQMINNSEIEIDLYNLTSGVYYIKTQTNTIKVIKH